MPSTKLSKKMRKMKLGQQTSKASIKIAPIAVTTQRTGGNKRIVQNGDIVTIHHRELLIANYTANSIFTVDSRIALNPGLSTYSSGSPMGTWLPSIAKNYDRYRFKKLQFHFTTYAATTTPGMLVMSYDPNPDNSVPQNLADAQNQYYSNGSVHQNFSLDLTSKVPTTYLYTRSGAVSTRTTYDAGFVTFSSIGGNGTPVGLIEVEYIVEFKQPQSNTANAISTPEVPVLPQQISYGSTAYNGLADSLYLLASSAGNIWAPTTLLASSSSVGSSLVLFDKASTPTATSGGLWLYPNGVSASPGSVQNCTFNAFSDAVNMAIGGTTRPWFNFPVAGRYRVEVEADFDIGIKSTAAYTLMGFKRSSATGPPPTWSHPIYEAAGLDGSITAYKAAKVFVQPGMENASTDPQTAGDGTWRFTWEIATKPDEYYALLGGVELSTLVAGTSCLITGRSSVKPLPRLVVTYLGSRKTDYDIYSTV